MADAETRLRSQNVIPGESPQYALRVFGITAGLAVDNRKLADDKGSAAEARLRNEEIKVCGTRRR